jgi:hypothetical protein
MWSSLSAKKGGLLLTNTKTQQMIVTPVNFVTFLVSLVLVDLRYTRLRMHSHHSVRESKLPTWLHDILYYRQPYDDVGGRRPGGSHERWHYHSNQKKLMKMEAEEAFRLRGTVLLFLAVLAATATGGTLYVANRLLSGWHGSQMRK